jgi:phosphohistidine phosphatase
MATAARGLATLFSPEAIVSSPLLRARQTADILRGAWKLKTVTLNDALADGDDDELFASLAGMKAERVVAVGHQPYLSMTLSLALTGDPNRVTSTLKKGAAALVVFDGPPAPGGGSLEWLLQPRALRRLAGSASP